VLSDSKKAREISFLPKDLYFSASPAAGLTDAGNPRIKKAQADFYGRVQSSGYPDRISDDARVGPGIDRG
jgi:hypothetical protein